MQHSAEEASYYGFGTLLLYSMPKLFLDWIDDGK